LAKLKPWYKVVTPREDLREGKPLDASEFAVMGDVHKIISYYQAVPLIGVK